MKYLIVSEAGHRISSLTHSEELKGRTFDSLRFRNSDNRPLAVLEVVAPVVLSAQR